MKILKRASGWWKLVDGSLRYYLIQFFLEIKSAAGTLRQR